MVDMGASERGSIVRISVSFYFIVDMNEANFLKGENIMQIFLFIILGIFIMAISVMLLAEFGLILLGGIAFGLILYITVKVSRIPSSKRWLQ